MADTKQALPQRLMAFRNAHWMHWSNDENQLVIDCFHALQSALQQQETRETALRIAGAAGAVPDPDVVGVALPDGGRDG